MRLFAALLAAMAQTMSAGSAQAQVPANCLNYLTADAAFEEAAAPYRQAKASVDKARREIIRLAESTRLQALQRAKNSYRNEKKAPESESLKAELNAALQASQRTYRGAVQIAKGAYKQAEAHAIGVYRETLTRYDTELERARHRHRLARRAALKSNASQSAKLSARKAQAAYEAVYFARKNSRSAADRKYGQAERSARAIYELEVRSARSVRDQANKAAQETYRIYVKEKLKLALAAFRSAIKIAERNFLQSKNAADEAYTKSLRAEREPYERVRKTWEDAYIAAYQNPERGVRRQVSGYDRALVLKVARYERRKFCPAL